MDLVQTGENVDVEKDFCLERFIDFAKRVTDELRAKGYWCDYIDPCSGLSMINRDSQHIYGEVDALVTLLNYQTTTNTSTTSNTSLVTNATNSTTSTNTSIMTN